VKLSSNASFGDWRVERRTGVSERQSLDEVAGLPKWRFNWARMPHIASGRMRLIVIVVAGNQSW
jgi:hypothetical protein